MTALACPDSLVARSRVGNLSSLERSQLQLHLQKCEACRVSLLVGRDFDAALAAQSDDTLFVSQVVRALRASPAVRAKTSRLPTRSRRAAHLLMYGVAAALLTCSFVVGAASPVLRRKLALFIGVQAPESSLAVRAASARAARVTSLAAEPRLLAAKPMPPPTIPQPAPTVEVQEEPAPAPAPHDEHRVIVQSAPAPDGRSAEEIFAQANAERRAGNLAAASRLYQELQGRYPRSREAEVSRVTVGRLLLEGSQDPKSALEQFDRALRAPNSERAGLAEEALFGRASALMRLGHRDDERSAWQQLIQQYPGSIYADRAHARLAELDAGSPAAVGIYPAQQ